MNIRIGGISKREDDDPEYADYWILLSYGKPDSVFIEWEVPVSKAELQGLWNEVSPDVRKLAVKQGFRPSKDMIDMISTKGQDI